MKTGKAVLEIEYSATGFKARCSNCGKLMRQALNCNRAGLVYAEAGAKEDFEIHRKKCKKKL